METRELLVLRGIPGCGKSTLAQVLSEEGKYPVFSVDDYFTDAYGNYTFVFSENHLAYKFCEDRTREAMKSGVSKIILDNTFTIDWEIAVYSKLAKEFGYRMHVMTVENHHGGKNIHGIPEEHLEKMKSKYIVKL